MSTTTDYKNTYFQHPSLTSIRGAPTYESLSIIYKEIKANANSVPTTLGGGNHGHLGLVITQTAYERIAPGTPYNRPANPGFFDVVQDGTQYQIAQAQELHRRNLKAFNEANLIERTLIQQIKEAIEPEYIEGLVNEETGLVVGTIPEIMAYLFETYGNISPTVLNEKREEMLSYTYDNTKPIDLLFTAINKYAGIADSAGSPETPSQLINIALIILSRSGVFSHDIRMWHAKPSQEKTWPNLRQHFKEAQKSIRMSGGTIDQLGLHNANAMVEKIIEGLHNKSTDTFASDQVAEHQMNEQIEHMANVANQNADLLNKVQELMKKIDVLEKNLGKKTTWKIPWSRGRRNSRQKFQDHQILLDPWGLQAFWCRMQKQGKRPSRFRYL